MVLLVFTPLAKAESVTNEMIYRKLLEIEKRQAVLEERVDQLEKRMVELREYMDKRFEQIDKRFELIDKRFEQMDEFVDKRFDQVDKRFDQVDNRFDEVNERFNQLINFLWMIVTIFTTLTAVVIGFAYWDRRTIIKKARDEAVVKIEEGTLRKLLGALRELAKEDKKLAEVLRNFGLL